MLLTYGVVGLAGMKFFSFLLKNLTSSSCLSANLGYSRFSQKEFLILECSSMFHPMFFISMRSSVYFWAGIALSERMGGGMRRGGMRRGGGGARLKARGGGGSRKEGGEGGGGRMGKLCWLGCPSREGGGGGGGGSSGRLPAPFYCASMDLLILLVASWKMREVWLISICLRLLKLPRLSRSLGISILGI
jgi:hypothetical protein